MGLLLGLTAMHVPLLLLICLAAQVAATLQALGHFSTPALAPDAVERLLALIALLVAPPLAPDRLAQAYVMAVARARGRRAAACACNCRSLDGWGSASTTTGPPAARADRQVVRTMLPMVVGLADHANQYPDGPHDRLGTWPPRRRARADRWLGGGVPLSACSRGRGGDLLWRAALPSSRWASWALAVATAIFPLLSRHAARGDRRGLGADLTLGLRLVLFLGMPAGLGL